MEDETGSVYQLYIRRNCHYHPTNHPTTPMYLLQISVLVLFFTYFVLLSGTSYQLLGCTLQRHIAKSVPMRHLITFLSIFLFAFVLDWYGVDDLRQYQSNLSIDERIAATTKQLGTYFLYSWLIYAIFLMTTKCHFGYLLATLLLGVLACATAYVDKWSQSADERKNQASRSLMRLRHLRWVVYAVMAILLVVGCGKNYSDTMARLRGRRSWSWVTYVFGACSTTKA